MFFRAVIAALLAAPTAAKHYSVLVVGDSWGHLGPSWTTLQETLDDHSVTATVRSTAVDGTTACELAARDGGTALVESAQAMFPDLPHGPDFVWYTLGGNDLVDKAYGECMRGATSDADAKLCFQASVQKINACTSELLETYWDKFPQSKVFQCGYDLQCLESYCMAVAQQRNPYCGGNVTCHNAFQVYWQHTEIGARQERYPQPQYTGLNILGTMQKAAGVVGADVGKPVLDQGSPCEWEVACVHPAPDTPAAKAIGEAFWDLFFSTYVGGPGLIV